MLDGVAREIGQEQARLDQALYLLFLYRSSRENPLYDKMADEILGPDPFPKQKERTP